ncbi:hypothetical protein QN382_08920 [Pseudomonas sp. 10B1]|uniref:hypothetical protein n=1 Tax=unclassified Pseudomonas TaxID=196821 RepID=UPI002AB53A7E|nr:MULTISPECIES: hypothetical protein [unclassified Pseudomonas]MDY7561731.1 hypothetical protein [Pseudomonas sp. AB6]MEA9979881.1 hypothetical protein [Pseudomonas sp. RTS4]MEA9996353.1 hypothetical protein [Pseudomonas sp. AA4]MEB0085841.1 hypothetical protein [Pseudomonas sp. RTI1]MEB0125834.1 hypothetical protein [Pseudomonas sp. CCC1.2]
MKCAKKAVLAGFLGLVASVSSVAASANTETKIFVNNRTSASAVFGPGQFSGSVTPPPGQIDGGRSTNFTLTSFGYQASGIRFTYTAGTKKCRFTASHLAMPSMRGHIPTWKKAGESIGSSRATCTASISLPTLGIPFNYTVNFTIQ